MCGDTASCGAIKSKNISNLQLADELHMPIISKVKKGKVLYIQILSFRDNIWSADLADMELISKYNEEI